MAIKRPEYCPVCNGSSTIYSTLHTSGPIRRRRRCDKCGYCWTTIEVLAFGYHPKSELEKTVAEAMARFRKLPAEERLRLRELQRRSWVVRETLLEHPEMSREDAEKLYDNALNGGSL